MNYPSNILGVLLSPEVSFATSTYGMRSLFGGYAYPLPSELWWSWDWLPHTVHLPRCWARRGRSRVPPPPLCCWAPEALRSLSLQTQEAVTVLGQQSLTHAITFEHAAPSSEGCHSTGELLGSPVLQILLSGASSSLQSRLRRGPPSSAKPKPRWQKNPCCKTGRQLCFLFSFSSCFLF